MQTPEASSSLEIILEMIARGVFSVDTNGVVWRHKIRTRWGYRDVARRRADHVFPVGYRYISATVNRRQIAVLAHRVIWTILNGKIPTGLEVNHRDGNRANNDPSNLELATSSENKRHSYRVLKHPRRGSPKFDHHTRGLVIELREMGHSYRSIEKETGVSAAAARQMVLAHQREKKGACDRR